MKDPARYIQTVVMLDFGRPLDELVALVILACGKPPPIKPYSAVSIWKAAATRILIDSVPGAQRTQVMGYAHQIVLVVLNIARGRNMGRPEQVKGYGQQIQSTRRAKT